MRIAAPLALLATLGLPAIAQAQGLERGAQEGASRGEEMAGPLGAIVGGAIGAAVGGLAGDRRGKTNSMYYNQPRPPAYRYY